MHAAQRGVCGRRRASLERREMDGTSYLALVVLAFLCAGDADGQSSTCKSLSLSYSLGT